MIRVPGTNVFYTGGIIFLLLLSSTSALHTSTCTWYECVLYRYHIFVIIVFDISITPSVVLILRHIFDKRDTNSVVTADSSETEKKTKWRIMNREVLLVLLLYL